MNLIGREQRRGKREQGPVRHPPPTPRWEPGGAGVSLPPLIAAPKRRRAATLGFAPTGVRNITQTRRGPRGKRGAAPPQKTGPPAPPTPREGPGRWPPPPLTPP